jgi:hypothetical protein
LIAVVISLAALLMTGCAKKPMWGDPDTGLILTYRMPEGSAFTYRSTNEFFQTMDIMGQSMKVTAEEKLTFTMSPKGMKEDNLLIAVTMDSMSMIVTMPQGDMEADVDPVLGKSFDIVLSPLGRELEIIGADEIKYNMGPEGDRSIESNFMAVFNDLPPGPVVVGDTWTQTDSILEAGDDGDEMLIVLNSTHTLAGFETMNGMECAKITTVFTGTLSGKGMEQGMELETEGTTEGTETWYFAYKKGYFVGAAMTGTAEGTIKAVNNPAFNIPMTREMNMSSKLVKMQ